VLRGINRSTRSGLRDYALLHVAFTSGLRLAELQRITLNSIQPSGDVYLITVRGKRSNVDPVPVSARAFADIMAWVDAYNAELPADDPRRIAGDLPIWQPLLHGDNYAWVGVNGFKPSRGMSAQGLRDIIERTTRAALGDQFALAAHDTRRTAAAIAYDAGMPLPSIQKLLRHKDAAVTLRYIGQKPDYDQSTLANYVSIG
jgi:site-specific recombinase XerD